MMHGPINIRCADLGLASQLNTPSNCMGWICEKLIRATSLPSFSTSHSLWTLFVNAIDLDVTYMADRCNICKESDALRDNVTHH